MNNISIDNSDSSSEVTQFTNEKISEFSAQLYEDSSSISNFFSKHYIVDVEALKQLGFRLDQEIEHCGCLYRKNSVSVRFTTGRLIKLRSFEEFETVGNIGNETVDEILLEFIYIVKGNVNNSPQKYEIDIGLRSSVTEFEKNLLSETIGNQSISTARMQITFANFVIGKNLAHTVEDWVSTLKVSPFPKYHKYIKLARKQAKVILPRVGLIAGIVAAYFLSLEWDFSSIFNATQWALLACLIAQINWLAFHYLGNKLSRKAYQVKEGSYLLITPNDIAQQQDIIAENSKVHASLLRITLANLGILIINLFSSYVYDVIKLF